jgi:hypothetical protein
MEQRAVLRPYLDGLEPLLKINFPERSRKLVNLTRFADGTPVQASNLWGASPLTPIVRSGV